MTHNEPTYREKGRALFLAVMMVLSVFAMSAAFAGGAAANVDETAEIEFSDVAVNVDSTDQSLTGDSESIDVTLNQTQEEETDENGEVTQEAAYDDAAVQIDISSLDTADVNLSESEVSVSLGDETEFTEDDYDINTDDGVINIYLTGDQAADVSGDQVVSINSVDITGLDTTEASAEGGLTYDISVANVSDSSHEDVDWDEFDADSSITTESFDLVDAGVSLNALSNVNQDRTLYNDVDAGAGANTLDTVATLTVGEGQSGAITLDVGEALDNNIDLDNTDAFNISEEDTFDEHAEESVITLNESNVELVNSTYEDGVITANLEDGDAADIDLQQDVDVTFSLEFDASEFEGGDQILDLTASSEAGSDSSSFRAIEVGTVVADSEETVRVDGTLDGVWEGETITAIADQGDVLTVYDEDSNEVVLERGTAPGEARNIDTTELGPGNYNVSVDDTKLGDSFEVLPLNLGVSVDDVEHDGDVVADITSDDLTGSAITVELVELNDDGEVVEVVSTEDDELNGDGEATVNFGQQTSNTDYKVVVTHDDSQVSTEDGLTVAEEPEGPSYDSDAEFADEDFEQVQGDVMAIDIAVEDPEGLESLDLNLSDDYFADISLNFESADVEGNQTITLYWNTAEAGNGDAAFYAVSEDGETEIPVSVVDETDLSDEYDLPASVYSANLYMDGEFSDRLDIDSFRVTEADSEPEISTYIAPEDTEYENITELLDSATEHNEVATGDILVHEITGLEGVFGQAFTAGDYTATEVLSDGGNGIYLNYTSTFNPSFDDSDAFDQSQFDAEDIYVDAESGSLYVVTDESDADADYTDEGESLDNPWDVTFSVGDDETAETSVEFIDGEFGLNPIVEEPYYVVNSSDAEIRGSSTYAPGTTFEVSVIMDGVFEDVYQNVEIVEEDGEFVWNITNDYSERAVGDAITIESTDFDSDNHGEVVEGEFSDTPEWDSVSEVEELEQVLDEILAQLDDVSEYENIAEAVSQLQSDLADAPDQSTVDDLNEQIDTLEGDLETAQDERDAAQSNLSDAQEEITTLEEQIDDLNEQLENAPDQSTVDDLNEQIDTLEDDLETAQSNYEDAQDEITSLEDQISTLEDDLETAQSDLETAEEERDAAQSDLDEFKNDLSDKGYDNVSEVPEEGEVTPNDPEDDDGNTTEDDDGDDGDDTTPGFGIAVALTALLGAAMLAIRRQN